MRFVFSNIEFLFFQIFQKPGILWMSCTQDTLPLLGYVQYLGDLLEGILPFWAFYEMDLRWTWTDKKLSLANCNLFKENLEWGLVLLA
jgi:hypothetical protein